MPFVSMYKRGFVIEDVDLNAFNIIKDEALAMLASNFKGCVPYNKDLAGVIKHEYLITKPHVLLAVEQAVFKATKIYCDEYNIPFNKLRLNTTEYARDGDVWINFQNKNEFNPIHVHHGHLSFVIYVRVPYDHKEINDQFFNNRNDMRHSIGSFAFLYPDIYAVGGVNIWNIPIDRSCEGKILIFSADQPHMVNPFMFGNEYRISVAGNININ